MTKHKSSDEATLLTKINVAVRAANDAEAKVTTAQAELVSRQAELVSRSKTVGLLLLEAKKLHPAVKDFEAFLKKVQGLKLSRALPTRLIRTCVKRRPWPEGSCGATSTLNPSFLSAANGSSVLRTVCAMS
jgi:hypothetical protein